MSNTRGNNKCGNERRGVCRLVLGALAGASLLLGVAVPASADGSRITGPMILNLLARPVESPDVAFSESIRQDAATPRPGRADEPEVLPDGSVRYGRTAVRVIIKDCPENDPFHDAAPRPLPGRTRR